MVNDPLATVWTIEVLASGEIAATSGPVNPFGNLRSQSHGVSASGAICGRVMDGDHSRAFVLGDGGLELLDETRKTVFSVAWDVNDLEAVGEITTAGRRAGTDDRDAVLWNDGGAKNLVSAYGVSESGIVVGDEDGWGRAFVRY